MRKRLYRDFMTGSVVLMMILSGYLVVGETVTGVIGGFSWRSMSIVAACFNVFLAVRYLRREVL